jgi:Tn3 transposase DDE domain
MAQAKATPGIRPYDRQAADPSARAHQIGFSTNRPRPHLRAPGHRSSTSSTFAIFHLAGLQFSPRIRDIGRLQLYRLGRPRHGGDPGTHRSPERSSARTPYSTLNSQ